MATQDVAHSWRDSYRGMSSDNVKGLVLALSSSFFIGASFIVKKKGLKKAGASGVRAGSLSALDTFNTAVVSPIYYVMFTSFTILASVIMFKKT
ncbi:Magnesium transporter NIPA [Dillenia turbinata]|uniref:Probable magnesium transporter n=1 Tax=Dillenia turbinata TaxID=194707 RepID=A0AAN8WBV7_9MAGN